MYSKKKISKLPAALFLIFLTFLTACFCQSTLHPENEQASGAILLDKIAAVVNGEIITLTDIDKAIQLYADFRIGQESEQEFYNRLLEELINYKVVYLEYQDDFQLKEEDYAAVIEKMGSMDRITVVLNRFDMEWNDFKAFIKERVVYELVLKNQLRVRINIKFKEIEEYYYHEYVPTQKRLELTPRSLIEMAHPIENHLKRERTRKRLKQSGWLTELRSSYTIENKIYKEKK
jgi:hypothetical protein